MPTALRRINPSAPWSPSRRSARPDRKPTIRRPISRLFFASGIARLLTGQVDDLAEPPIRPVGEQSAFIGGFAAACAGMHAVLRHTSPARCIDVSIAGSAGDAGDDRTGARRA